MATCPNCKKNLSCGCQKRKASDGAVVCTNCIGTYKSKNVSVNSISSTSVAKPVPTQWTSEQIESAMNTFSFLKNKLSK